jgi:Ca-activated chloride channel family protein
MSFNADDPKYTAYVLNELSEPERAEVREEIRQNPEVRDLVKGIHAFSVQLQIELHHEPVPALDDKRRQAILARSRQQPRGGRRRVFRWTLGAVAIAATLLVAATVFWRPASREIAARPEAWRARSSAHYDHWETAGEIEEPSGQLECRLGLDADMGASRRDEELRSSAELILDPFEVAPTQHKAVASPEGRAAAPGYVATRPRPTPETQLDAILPLKDSNAIHDRRLEDVVAERTPEVLVRTICQNRPSNHESKRAGQPFLSPSLDDFPELRDNKFIRVADHPLSTFSIDVDTASYSVVRKFLVGGRMPPKDAVRVEELINYFPYDLAPPEGNVPFAAHLEMAPAPWNSEHRLVRIALKGRTIPREVRPPLNLVFLLDVSGSMSSENRLPLVIRSMQTLARQLDARDHVAIVVYAGAAGLVLPPTRGDNTQVIVDALGRLNAGGSTAGGAGIQLAYDTAREHFDPEAMNRVILCTDGDFNVGLTQRGDLERLIEEQARSRIFLSVLGFGMGNYKDSTLELLSNKGNGNYAYIDDFNEARKVLVDQMLGTLVTIAKDVKIQVEFNPACVAGYRLVGYENRLLRKEDFNNDRVDAGDIGAGHTVTAFYELIPAGHAMTDVPLVDPLKYQARKPESAAADVEMLTVKVRYKEPEGDISSRLDFPLRADAAKPLGESTPEFRFAAAVAAFGQLLRENEQLGSFGYDQVLALAEPAAGDDPQGHRAEFLKLVRNAKALVPNAGSGE